MRLGSTSQPGPPPSMARAAFSALVLFVGIILLAKTVMVAPVTEAEVPAKPAPTPRAATRQIPVRPSATRLRVPLQALGGYRRGTAQFRAISEPQAPARPIHIASEIDGLADPSDNDRTVDNVRCGVEHVIHQREPVDERAGRAPPEFKIGADEGANRNTHRSPRRKVSGSANRPSPQGEASTVNKKSAARVKRLTQRPAVGGLKPLAKDELPPSPPSKLTRQTLIMESPDWHVTGEHSESMKARRDRIQRCLDFYYDRPLINMEDSPWSMMHHMIAWGVDSRIIIQTKDNKTRPVSTIGWLCGNGVCDGHKLLYVENGRIRARVGPGLQGHAGQFLAMLAQTRVSRKQRFLIDGDEFTTAALIREEQLQCMPRAELSFKLIGLSHYLPTDAKWKNAKGQNWSIARLVDEELRQPINGTTCGGTHRLMGFTYAIARRRLSGGAITGPWAEAELVAKRHQQLAFRMQNRDGSFSSDFFRSAGSWGDMNRKLKTTGHVLEWLVFSLPPEQLDDPRILRSMDYLTHLLTTNRYYDWENGPLGHGIRALALYDERVFGRKPGKRDLQMAKTRPKLQPRSGSSQSRPPQKNRAATTRPPFRAFRRQ